MFVERATPSASCMPSSSSKVRALLFSRVTHVVSAELVQPTKHSKYITEDRPSPTSPMVTTTGSTLKDESGRLPTERGDACAHERLLFQPNVRSIIHTNQTQSSQESSLRRTEHFDCQHRLHYSSFLCSLLVDVDNFYFFFAFVHVLFLTVIKENKKETK